jgi:hypothetical protein
MKPDLSDMAIEDVRRRVLGLPPVRRRAIEPATLLEPRDPCAAAMARHNLERIKAIRSSERSHGFRV